MSCYRHDPKISVSACATGLAERNLLCFWRDILLYVSVEDNLPLYLVFSTDAVCALWPIWSSGVVQGSLRLSGGGLMVQRLSPCACHGCVCCMSLRARGSIIVILTDTFTLFGLKWQPIHQAIVVPQHWFGCCANGFLLSFCFFIIALTTLILCSWSDKSPHRFSL